MILRASGTKIHLLVTISIACALVVALVLWLLVVLRLEIKSALV